MHPEQITSLADVRRREDLAQATRLRERRRYVTTRVPARTRTDVPRHQAR